MNNSFANNLSFFDQINPRSHLMLENPNQITLEYEIQVSNQLSICQREIKQHLSANGEKIPSILHKISELQVPARVIVNSRFYLYLNALRNNYYNNQIIRRQCNIILENWMTIIGSAVAHDYHDAMNQIQSALQNQYNPRLIPINYSLCRPTPPPPRARASGSNYKSTQELPQEPDALPSTPKKEPPTINIDIEDHIDGPYEPKPSQTATTTNESKRYDLNIPKIKIPRLDKQESEVTTKSTENPTPASQTE